MLSFFIQHPLLWLISVFIFSLCVGSFLNVVIYRFPKIIERCWREEYAELMQTSITPIEPFNLCIPASHCPHCQQRLALKNNIPVLSYLFQKGKCSQCKAAISARYPVVELLTAILSVWLAHHFGPSSISFAAIIFTWLLICLSFIDLDTQLLPDDLNYILLWLGLLFNINALFVPLENAVIGALVGYLSLWLITQLFLVLTGKQGMGNGDFKLFAAFGAWFGWLSLPLIIVLAAVMGLVIGVVSLMRQKKSLATPIPFGPSLALAAWLYLLYGNDLLNYYLQFLKI